MSMEQSFTIDLTSLTVASRMSVLSLSGDILYHMIPATAAARAMTAISVMIFLDFIVGVMIWMEKSGSL